MNDDAVSLESSGNIYADVGEPDAEAMLRKARIAVAIETRIRDLNLTQRAAATMTGIPQPRLSALRNGRFRGITETRMLEALRALGNDVEVVIRPPRSDGAGPGHMTVTFAAE
ncbi:helix-turn-helix domain-containing protein [Roseospira navarrensis]|uniref:Helix-turn-helix domain-containing protein n=1 Tax=Roseospira navarrensis TaxID=140058 RepID=A0A7X1ZHF3_9PROT|nr:helix-turn-helix transcriptional regulator [Roseospira navarrensis]MQX38570.1 helix-turn-helix domain-containing protein [Roseospira navarrensis]